MEILIISLLIFTVACVVFMLGMVVQYEVMQKKMIEDYLGNKEFELMDVSSGGRHSGKFVLVCTKKGL